MDIVSKAIEFREAVRLKVARYLSGDLAIATTSNVKILKNVEVGYKTIGVNFAPAESSVHYGGFNTCKGSTPGCRGGCLRFSGHNVSGMAGSARIARTVAYNVDPWNFMRLLKSEIKRFEARETKKGFKVSYRGNLLSDLVWLSMEIAQEFPDIQCVDYTKRIGTVERMIPAYVPDNMSWGLSLSESNFADWHRCLLAGKFWGAVVFDVAKGQPLPESFAGLPCIDGDVHDARWLTPKGTIAALRIKGTKKAKAIARKSGFAVSPKDPRCNR
jgi:hypothetical protein